MSLRESMMGLVLWAIVKFVWCLVFVVRNADWKIDTVFLKKYLPLVWPLLLFAAIGKGSEYVSGLTVSLLFEDEKAFAVFRYGARELPLAVLMVGALVTALTPELAENQHFGLERIKSQTRQLSHWLYPLSMFSMLVAPFAFPVFFNADFSESARIFNVFTLLLSSRILLPQVVTMAAGKNYVLTISALVELAVLIVLSFWWGKSFGLIGVAWAAIASFMVDRAVLIWYNWRVLKISPNDYVDWRTWGIYNLALFGVFILSLQLI